MTLVEPKEETKMSISKINTILNNPHTLIVWDIDGTLTSYNYGECHCHHELDGEIPESEFRKINLYPQAKPLPIIQRFVTEHSKNIQIALSVEPHGYEKEKETFVKKYYPGITDVVCVGSEDEKLEYLKRLDQCYKDVFPDTKFVVYVDDHTQFLHRVEKNTNIYTAHVTLFFE